EGEPFEEHLLLRRRFTARGWSGKQEVNPNRERRSSWEHLVIVLFPLLGDPGRRRDGNPIADLDAVPLWKVPECVKDDKRALGSIVVAPSTAEERRDLRRFDLPIASEVVGQRAAQSPRERRAWEVR